MHAQLHPSATPIDRPWYALVAVVLELFTAFGAIPVGIMLITDPTGAGVGFPPGRIEATPFGSYMAMSVAWLRRTGQLRLWQPSAGGYPCSGRPGVPGAVATRG